jgi:hypothetical protein
VVDYVDKSTGIQTILQMEALVEMVKEFGIVPPDRILDKAGYKAIYNRSLLDVVEQRIETLNRGCWTSPTIRSRGRCSASNNCGIAVSRSTWPAAPIIRMW